MKTNLLFIAAVSLMSTASYAQTIPNAGFENWTTTTFSDPDNWGTFNSTTAPLGASTVEQGAPGNPGSFYIKITSKTIAPLGIVPGVAVTGIINIATQSVSGGFPISSRPAKLTGKWQYMSYGITDTGSVTVLLSHWNTITHAKDTVSYTHRLLTGMVMSWASFNIILNYQSSSLTPDTAMIVLAASNATPANNSYLYVDALAFTGSVGIDENSSSAKMLSVYPNPSSNLLNVSFTLENSSNVKVQLLDLSGKLLQELNSKSSVGENTLSMNLEGIDNGIYFVRLLTDNGTETKKIVIE